MRFLKWESFRDEVPLSNYLLEDKTIITYWFSFLGFISFSIFVVASTIRRRSRQRQHQGTRGVEEEEEEAPSNPLVSSSHTVESIPSKHSGIWYLKRFFLFLVCGSMVLIYLYKSMELEEKILMHMMGKGPCFRPKDLIGVYGNLGNWKTDINSSFIKAKQLWNQGLLLNFGFNKHEANANFKQAIIEDPNCIMCYWGIAYSHSPFVNGLLKDSNRLEAINALEKATEICKKQNLIHTRECNYIEALKVRFPSSEQLYQVWNRTKINQIMIPFTIQLPYEKKYVKSMRLLVQQYKNDVTARSLYVEALMCLSPWDYYLEDGETPKEHIDIAMKETQVGLKQDPSHPLLLHLWIHLTEPSEKHKWKAIEEAHRIIKVCPNAGHLVHMASHIYLRVGMYDQAIHSNQLALKANQHFMDNCLVPYAVLHNRGLLVRAAIESGQYEIAHEYSSPLKIVEKLWAFPTPFYAHPNIFILTQFGKWELILEMKEISSFVSIPYLKALWHYAKGLAYASIHQIDQVNTSYHEIHEACQMIPDEIPEPFTGTDFEMMIIKTSAFYPAHKQMCLIAEYTLASRLAFLKNKKKEMLSHLKKAVNVQDRMDSRYLEPPRWYTSTRQCLGAMYYALEEYPQALKEFQTDLKLYPHNVWSIRGEYDTLNKLKMKKNMTKIENEKMSSTPCMIFFNETEWKKL